MIYVKKIITKGKQGSISFCLFGLNEENENSYEIIGRYLKEHLACEVIACSNFVVDFIVDYKKDDIIFRFIYEEGYEIFEFCSHNRKQEPPEYYEKLEKIVQELVNVLNRDNHKLNIALK